MTDKERLIRIDENMMHLNWHFAVRRGLEQEGGKGTTTWKANETIISEFETRIQNLQGKQDGKWVVFDRQHFVEVVPEEDEKPHGLGDECWCNPKVEKTDGAPLISHYSIKESKL